MPVAKLSTVIAAIEAYFARHPDAADSVEGVADWWLAGIGVEARVDEVRDALEILVERGSVATRRMPDGRLIYARARRPQDMH